jgi:leucine dehydrogenase
MGDFVESLQGRYITSFDSGTSLEDVRTIATHTRFAAGTMVAAGNASGSTAYGVCQCIKAAAHARLGHRSLEGVHVAIQGLGNVGSRLAEMLHQLGATLTVADLDATKAERIASRLGAQVVSVDEIHRIRADVFSPCALGGVLSAQTIPELACKAIVGGANNQLASAADDQRLLDAGILYCPDYLANAGGIIDVHYQRSGWSRDVVERHVDGLTDTFRQVIEQSTAMRLGTARIADRIAESRFHPADSI